MSGVQPEHLLDASGEGFFSVGTCTGCTWEMKGHRNDIEKVFEAYHEQAEGLPVEMPPRVPLPPLTGDAYVGLLEHSIIATLAGAVRSGAKPDNTLVTLAVGLAWARTIYIAEGEPTWAREHGMGPRNYVATMMAKIKSLSPRQQEKLRHPATDRHAQQEILESNA